MKTIILNSGVPTALLALKQGMSYEKYDAKKINAKTLSTKDFLNFAKKLWYMDEKKQVFGWEIRVKIIWLQGVFCCLVFLISKNLLL